MTTLRLVLCSLIFWLPHYLMGQFEFITFNDSLYLDHVRIDYDENPDNVWQIGVTEKSDFLAGNGPLRAMMTDTVFSYPASDTSIAYINLTTDYINIFFLTFSYKVDCDTINDYGLFEVSGDDGQTWFNPIAEADDYRFDIFNEPSSGDIFTGSMPFWSNIGIDMEQWRSASTNQTGNFPSYISSDTLRLRYTFISDEINSGRAGWIIDDMKLDRILANSEEAPEENILQVYPNPVSNRLHLRKEKPVDLAVNIYNLQGKLLLSRTISRHLSSLEIDVSTFPKGLYFIETLSDEGTEVLKMVKK